MTLLEKMDRMPPCACRLLARKRSGWEGMSHSDLAKATGLPRTQVAELSVQPTWSGITVGVAISFSAACGVNLLNPSKSLSLLRKRKLVHVTRASGNQKVLYSRIFEALKSRQI